MSITLTFTGLLFETAFVIINASNTSFICHMDVYTVDFDLIQRRSMLA